MVCPLTFSLYIPSQLEAQWESVYERGKREATREEEALQLKSRSHTSIPLYKRKPQPLIRMLLRIVRMHIRRSQLARCQLMSVKRLLYERLLLFMHCTLQTHHDNLALVLMP